MVAYLLRGLALGFPAASTPGPLQALYFGLALRSGWRRTLPAAFAPLLSDGPIILLVILLLSQIPPALVRSLHLIGGVFLLFLAWSAYRTLSAPPTLETTNTSVRAGLLKATLANLLNPNPYLFWSLVAGPLLLESWRQSPRHAAGFLLGFYLTLIGGFAAQIIVFATAGRLDKRLTKILGGLSALVLLLFGLYQIRLGLIPDSP